MTDLRKRVQAAIDRLEKSKKPITPRNLWESARSSTHPLHDQFEWDDSVAAAIHRDEQARRLLRIRVDMVYKDRVIEAPICVRTPESPSEQPSYTRTVQIMGNKERSRQVLLEELDRASKAIERAKMVANALGLARECERLLESLLEIRQQAAE